MIRREFLKVLGSLPFLGFLNSSPREGKTEDQRDVEDSLESLKEPGGVPLETFAQTLGTTGGRVISCHCEFDGGLHRRTCRFEDNPTATSLGCHCLLNDPAITNITWVQRWIA